MFAPLAQNDVPPFGRKHDPKGRRPYGFTINFILRTAVNPRLIFIGRSRTPPLQRQPKSYIQICDISREADEKSFVCDDSRNIVYAKHNIICRKATSFSDRKRKLCLRPWRKMMFLPAVGNTTLRVAVPLPPREGLRIPKAFNRSAFC